MTNPLVCLLAMGCSGCAVLGGVVNRTRPTGAPHGDNVGRQPAKATPDREAKPAPDREAKPTPDHAESLPQLPDDGITSEAHRKYLGQIVFSTSEIAKDNPDESKLGAEFYADEWIYGRVFLRRSIENYPVFEDGSDTPLRTETRGYLYNLYVDGEPVKHDLETRYVSHERRRSTTLQVRPHPAPSDEPTPRGWVELVNSLSPGDHVVRIELWAHDRWRKGGGPLATGELTLHKPAGVSIGTGRTFADMKRGMKDPALERVLASIARGFAKEHKWKETFTEIAIESPQWIDMRHKLGFVMGRRLQTQALGKWPDGKCTAQALLFEQKIEYGRPVGPIYVGSSAQQTLIDCAPTAAHVTDRWKGRVRAKPAPTKQDASPTAASHDVDGGRAAQAQTPAAPAKPRTTSGTADATPAVRAKPVRPRVAAATPASDDGSVGKVASPAPPPAGAEQPGRFAIGVGAAANANDATGIASYANLGVHLGRVQLGVGATWPLNAFGYARFAVIGGRFELSPMISASVMAEAEMTTEIALAGGVSLAYAVKTGPVSAGLRVDALVSYNPEPAAIAIPVFGSTYVRF